MKRVLDRVFKIFKNFDKNNINERIYVGCLIIYVNVILVLGEFKRLI